MYCVVLYVNFVYAFNDGCTFGIMCLLAGWIKCFCRELGAPCVNEPCSFVFVCSDGVCSPYAHLAWADYSRLPGGHLTVL